MSEKLPYEPESIEQARARWHAAVEKVWDVDQIAADHAAGQDPDRAGLHRAHVFDLEHDLPEPGLLYRLIVSVERSAARDLTLLHASAGVLKRRPYTPQRMTRDELLLRFGLVVLGLVDRLSDNASNAGPREAVVTSGGILHLAYPWPLIMALTPEALELAKSMPRYPEPDPRRVAVRIQQLRQMGFGHGPLMAGQPSSLEQYARIIAFRDQEGAPRGEPTLFATRNRELLGRAVELLEAFGVMPVDVTHEEFQKAVAEGRGYLPESFGGPTQPQQ